MEKILPLQYGTTLSQRALGNTVVYNVSKLRLRYILLELCLRLSKSMMLMKNNLTWWPSH